MHFLYTSEFGHKYISLKSILLSLKTDTSVQKVYLKDTSEFENRYICLESLLEVHF